MDGCYSVNKLLYYIIMIVIEIDRRLGDVIDVKMMHACINRSNDGFDDMIGWIQSQ